MIGGAGVLAVRRKEEGTSWILCGRQCVRMMDGSDRCCATGTEVPISWSAHEDCTKRCKVWRVGPPSLRMYLLEVESPESLNYKLISCWEERMEREDDLILSPNVTRRDLICDIA